MRTAGSLDDLMAYVAKRVRLRKTGRRWVGLCPFHNEKTPSFGIFVGKRGEGRYHCHGCSADGDLGDWLREVEHEESGRRRTVVRPPMPDIRQPAPHCVYLGDDPAAWARHHFREYDDYCRRHLPDELIEVARIDQNRRLIEAERNALLEETAPDADASPTSSDAFRAWVRAERAAGPVEPDS